MTQKFVFKKPNFGPPPKGYVAGLGRGATGFITRSDLGPAQISNNANVIQSNAGQDANYNQSKYDNWQGYKGALFSKNIVDQQDKQAEQAYDYCQRKMDQRRAKVRQQRIKKQIQKYKDINVPINQKFKDLKRQLTKVSVQEWQNIPEAVDSSIKKKNREKYVPVPDSVMVNFLTNNNSNSIVEENQNNKDYRDAKQTLLKSKLNQIQQKQSSIDKIGYLTQLNTSKINPEMIGDVNKARLLLKSAMQSNPKNPDVWISAARIQELDGKLNDARQILQKGVSQCPLNQDLWIQFSRLQKFQNAKNVVVQGLKHIPTSQKLWIYAAKLQNENKQMKSKILRKGLQTNPSSVKLWKQLIQIEDLQEAKKLLYKAVQYIPKQIDLWLALSKIQNYQNAKKILNMARKANPLSQIIWINAAKLQQSNFLADKQNSSKAKRQKNVQKIQNILLKARQILKKNGKNVSREQWLDEALYCQKSQNYMTCQAIVKISLRYNLNEQQILNAIIKDTKIYEEQRDSQYLVRYLYKYGVYYLKDKMLFEKLILFQERLQKKKQQEIIQMKQQQNGNQNINKEQKQQSNLIKALSLGLNLFPEQSKFWLMTIEKNIMQKKYQIAQEIIKFGQNSVENSLCEQIKLQRVKILKQQNKFIQAKCQLQILCKNYPKGKSKIQFINFQFQRQQYEKAWQLCQDFYKQMHVQQLWILAFKILIKLEKFNPTKVLIQKSISLFPNSITLWRLWIQFELENGNVGRARSILDKALLKNPKQQTLFLIGFQIQFIHGSSKDASFFLAKAIKACPKSPQLWAKIIQIQPIASRKKKASIAIQNCGASSAILNCSIAKIFWKQNKIDKAKKWISSSLELERKNGDIWCLYLIFLKQNYLMQFKIIWEQFIKTQIKEGRIWNLKIQKYPTKTKQQIYEEVVKQIDEQLLRIH